jgi:hypothetical protein
MRQKGGTSTRNLEAHHTGGHRLTRSAVLATLLHVHQDFKPIRPTVQKDYLWLAKQS